METNHNCNCKYCESNRSSTFTKLSPKNRMHAFAFQFEDDVKHLNSMAMLGDEKSYQDMLTKLKVHISSYEEMSNLKSM